MKRAAIAALALACHGAPRPPPPAPPAPPPITCEQLAPVAQHLVRADGARRLGREARAQLGAALGQQLVHACLVDGWSPDALACLHDARAASDVAACDRTLRPIERDHLGRALAAIVAQALRAAGPADVAVTGIPECDEYLEQVDRYATCPMIPDAAIEAARETMEALRSSWADAARQGATPEVRQMAAAACALNRDALLQAMAALGCE